MIDLLMLYCLLILYGLFIWIKFNILLIYLLFLIKETI